MAKKKTWRRYYRKSFRRYKQVSNYFRVKVEYYDRLRFMNYEPGTEEAGQNGGPLVFEKRANQVADADRTLSLADIMAQYTYTNTLQGLFSYYRPTGIRIEVIPDARNATIPSITTVNNQTLNVPYYQCIISYRSGSNQSQTLSEARSNNQSIVLNPNQKISKYWRIYGTTSAYSVTNTNFAGAFTIRNEYPTGVTQEDARQRSLSVYRLQPSWSVKINIYYLYKYSKA